MSGESFVPADDKELALEDEWNEPSLPKEFHVRNEVTANWVVRKIVECRQYAERCQEWCRREQARAHQREAFFLFHFGVPLREFARKTLAEEGGRRKSVFLPGGTIGFRTQPAKLMIDDEAVVLSWAKRQMPGLVQVSERISKSDLNNLFKDTGLIPDAGAHVEPTTEQFFVK
jgi:hypothetical protein